eukprot:TRINITY_DN2901_c1_g1_i1.p1 TRINITY_DN2901_c1_g1~~TRINITY_DN2901_c1_g1_i1.p1  ORF type:complete len:254 (+),score=54.13 TRINITY_DN2901_c1_g1_i1:68-829(+)
MEDDMIFPEWLISILTEHLLVFDLLSISQTSRHMYSMLSLSADVWLACFRSRYPLHNVSALSSSSLSSSSSSSSSPNDGIPIKEIQGYIKSVDIIRSRGFPFFQVYEVPYSSDSIASEVLFLTSSSSSSSSSTNMKDGETLPPPHLRQRRPTHILIHAGRRVFLHQALTISTSSLLKIPPEKQLLHHHYHHHHHHHDRCIFKRDNLIAISSNFNGDMVALVEDIFGDPSKPPWRPVLHIYHLKHRQHIMAIFA